MNALGALTIIPVASTWFGTTRKRIDLLTAMKGALLAAGTSGLLFVMMELAPPGITGVLLLDLGLPIALFAAVRFGQVGAASIGALSAMVVAIAASHGIGPFGALPKEDRQIALQLFELAIATFPLVIGALISERQEAMSNGLKDRELLASINRNVDEGLFRVTPDLSLVYMNGAFARMFGLGQVEETSGHLAKAVRQSPLARGLLQQLVRKQCNLVHEEVELRHDDGSVFWGLISVTAIRDREGAILHYDGAIADITAHKDLEGQFRQAQKMEAVGKLAGGIAHDFNNLLTAIFGYAESIKVKAGRDQSISIYADGVLNAAHRAAGLTRQLLAYSRQQVLSPQVIDLAGSIDRLTDMLGRLIGEDITLLVSHAAEDIRVRVDRGQLEQVIMNLVVNARDAMPAGGTVTISSRIAKVDEPFARAHPDLQPGPYVALCVDDTGVGMPPEVQARAFDPFYTTKGIGQGTGLGLSTAIGIIKQSDGAIWLDSQPGSGTRVWIYLPRVEANLDDESEEIPAISTASNATVLVVEDEPIVREIICEALIQAGFTVLQANNGVGALNLTRGSGRHIDLVITDVVMPQMGGRELAMKLSEERPGTRFLFMSGYASHALDLTSFKHATVEFIPKPFTSRDLIERVHSLLRPPGRDRASGEGAPVQAT
jgi:PAS domain S-box-containing protein